MLPIYVQRDRDVGPFPEDTFRPQLPFHACHPYRMVGPALAGGASAGGRSVNLLNPPAIEIHKDVLKLKDVHHPEMGAYVRQAFPASRRVCCGCSVKRS